MSTLIKNTTIIPMLEPGAIIEQGYIIIEGNLIKEVGSGSIPPGNYDKIIDGTDKIVIPGLINTHTHAAMTLLRGYADDLPLMEWLETKIWPLEAKLTGEDCYWGTMLAITEMIKSGTTTFADMYFFMDRAAQAVKESGIRGILSRGMVGVGPENEKAIADTLELADKWHKKADDRIRVMFGPHAPYTCPPDYLNKVLQEVAKTKLGIHMHIAETRYEFETIETQYGLSPVQHLEKIGLFNYPVLAAHCVHVTAEDIQILKMRKVGIAHNPKSNMKLASGIAPVPEMLAAGISVGIGTDGASSNNNLDMIEEMKTCALLHKVNTMNPTVIPAHQGLQMATVNGARVLGIEDITGSIKPGLRADLVIMELSNAHMTPCYDVVSNLVYSANSSDVQTVIINGEIVMENRVIKTFDEQEVMARARSIVKRLANIN